MESEILNILVVDDEPIVRDILIKIISRIGHQVVPAQSAEEILELLPYWTFQIAFLDNYLPGMDGLMLGEYLRQNNPQMTIALITGAPDRRLERKSIEFGLKFIEKPFRSEQIIDVINCHLAAVRDREQEQQQLGNVSYVPVIREYIEEITAGFNIPNIPSRIEDRIVNVIKQSLNNLRTSRTFNENDRVIAFSGLLTAKVLGVTLPKSASNRSLFEEYDALMRTHGRRQEFSSP